MIFVRQKIMLQKFNNNYLKSINLGIIIKIFRKLHHKLSFPNSFKLKILLE